MSTGTQYLRDVLLVTATLLALCGGGLIACKLIACSAKPNLCQLCLVLCLPVSATLRVLCQWPKWLLL